MGRPPENIGLSGSAMQGDTLAGTVKSSPILGGGAPAGRHPRGRPRGARRHPSRSEILAPGAATLVVVPRDSLMAFDAVGRRTAQGRLSMERPNFWTLIAIFTWAC